MNKIMIKKVSIKESKITFDYEIEGSIKKYFNQRRSYTIDYYEDIQMVPASIAVIPFFTNILPIAWIFDAVIEVEELDQDFYESIPKFKKGYQDMYPMISFKGSIQVKKIIQNKYTHKKENVAAFFSGGVDALSTLVTHMEEKPLLLTLWGSDIKLEDEDAWNTVKEQINETAKEFGLKNLFIKTEFRYLFHEKLLDFYVQPKCGDKWWHGFQHGIAIIGHAAPVSYKYKLDTVYIAASFTPEFHSTCASDPTIDNYVKLSNTSIFHDGYNYARNEKILNVCEYCDQNHKNISFRVCLGSKGDKNCCRCEKCYRTIVEIIIEGKDPKNYGFNIDETTFQNMEHDMKNRILLGHTKNWERIQKHLNEKKDIFKNDKRLNWIYDYDFSKVNKPIQKYVYRVYFAIKKRVKRLLHVN